jgi:SAM-dependent methyltransferase
MSDGWDTSASAWIASQGSDGDWARRHVLDAPMLARVQGRGFQRALDLPDASVDLVVCYLTLIDIPDLPAAVRQVRRVLRPGGSLLIANLQAFNTASVVDGWTREPDGSRRFCIDHYMEERARWVQWNGIRVQNWHRPLGSTMQTLLGSGFVLRHFEEPLAHSGDAQRAERYRRVPHFLVMEWEKPGA